MCFHRFEPDCISEFCSVTESFMKEKKKRMWNTLTPDPQVVLQLDQGPQEAQEESRRGGAKWDADEIAKLSLTLSIALTE